MIKNEIVDLFAIYKQLLDAEKTVQAEGEKLRAMAEEKIPEDTMKQIRDLRAQAQAMLDQAQMLYPAEYFVEIGEIETELQGRLSGLAEKTAKIKKDLQNAVVKFGKTIEADWGKVVYRNGSLGLAEDHYNVVLSEAENNIGQIVEAALAGENWKRLCAAFIKSIEAIAKTGDGSAAIYMNKK